MPIDVIDTIVPKNSGAFPVVTDVNVAGGFQVQPTTAARDAIPIQNQKVGMLVYVTANTTYYVLTATGSPGTWAVANLGSATSLSGDVIGSTSANTVTKIQGTVVSTNSVANDGYALVSTGGAYIPAGIQSLFNVKNFGAKGDGTTNDTVAIQSAINAAVLAHGTVYFPAGNYKVMSEINVLPNVFGFYGLNIIGEGFADGGQGAGGDRTTIFAGTAMRSVINMARSGVVCRYFKVDGNHFATYAIYCQGISISTFTNIMTVNAKIDGWHLAANYDNNPSLSPTFNGAHCINDQSKWHNCWAETNGNVYTTTNIAAQYANLGIPHSTIAGTVATSSGTDLLTFTSTPDLTTLNIRNGDVIRIGPALSDTTFSTTSSTSVGSAGSHTIVVSSATNIFDGQYIGIDTSSNFEVVEVQSIIGTSLTATFAKTHSGTYTVFANITQFYQVCVVDSSHLRVLGSDTLSWPTSSGSGLDFAICVGNGYHEEQSGDNNAASIFGGYWDQNACFGLMFAGLYGPHVTHAPQCQLNGVAGIGLGYGPNTIASVGGQEVLGSKFDRAYFEANIGGDMFIGSAAGFEICEANQQGSPTFGIAHDATLSFGYASFAFPTASTSTNFFGKVGTLQGSLYPVGNYVNRIPTTVLTNGQLQGYTGFPEAQPTISSSSFQFSSNQSVVSFNTDGSDHILTSTPTIIAPPLANSDVGNPQGVILILTNNSSNTVTLQRHDTLTGSNLQMETSTLAIGPKQSVQFMYFVSAGGVWRQIGKLITAS